MSWKDTSYPILARIPSIKRPTGHVKFNHKIMWTGLVLLAYFLLTNVGLFGLSAESSDLFGQFRSILAGEQGSILQLGIGPIVTAGITMQLLKGANLLPLDLTDPRDQALYQSLQKAAIIFVGCLTAFFMVFVGNFLSADPSVAEALGLTLLAVNFLIFLQISFGGVIILYLDEIITKWGIGSGVGLFIIAGVSQAIIGGFLYEVLAGWYAIAVNGLGASPLTADGLTVLFLGEGYILAVLTTLFIIAIVVAAESTRIEIPLSSARIKGARGRFPVKLIYASVMPLIFVRAIQANIQFMGQITASQLGDSMPAWLGTYVDGQAVGGLFYYLTPIFGPQDWMWFMAGATGEPWQIGIRILVDLTFLIVGGALFAVFWVETADMGASSSAKQIHRSGMQIPGFRRNTQIVEKVLDRYIPYITVLGGVILGVLAAFANLLGTIGGVTGTGLLLAVSITYKLYEEIANEQLMEMNPLLRQFFD